LPFRDRYLALRPAFVDKLTAAGYARNRADEWRVPVGMIVAVAIVTDCIPVEKLESRPINVYEYAFGDYTPGRYAWLLDQVRPLAQPVACRGYQQIWAPDAETVAKVEAQLR
jgi:hypothetical protein